MKVENKLKDDPTLASRYLADQLSEAERDAFETSLLRDPEVAQELEATARLKVGLGRLRESGELDKIVRARPFFERPAFLAAAASIGVLAIGLVFVRWQGATAPSVLASSASEFIDVSGKALAVGSTPPMLRLRSEKYDAEIELPRHALRRSFVGKCEKEVQLVRLEGIHALFAQLPDEFCIEALAPLRAPAAHREIDDQRRQR